MVPQMTALNLAGFDDGEPTLEVWEAKGLSAIWWGDTPGWYWLEWANHATNHGPFNTRDLALADAAAHGADVSKENIL